MKNILAGAAFFLTIGLASASAMASPGYAPGHSTLYAGPGVNYPVVAHIPPHASLNVQGCLQDGKWCNVFWGGNYGWTTGRNVEIVSHHHDVALNHVSASDRPHIIVYNVNQYWDNHYRNAPFYAMREQYGYNAYPVPVAATGRPPLDRPSDPANPSVHNSINHMIDDRQYSK